MLPAEDQGYSGKIALRLPRSLHRQAALMADRDGVSLNQYLVVAIANQIADTRTTGRLSPMGDFKANNLTVGAAQTNPIRKAKNRVSSKAAPNVVKR
jgi:hypothetical protein